MLRFAIATLSLVLLGLGMMPSPTLAMPHAETWDLWQAYDPQSVQTIDHQAWADFLTRYVRIGSDGAHRVTYGEVTAEDRAALDAYLDRLAKIPIGRYNRSEQLAYWINLYNALTVRLVLDHYPIASIRDIDGAPRPLSGGPWDEKLIAVDGTPVSLNDIVNRILRPIFDDPRVLYALSCGAIGCPNLKPEPYTGAQIDHQLSKAAMAYVNDPRCLSFEGDELGVSSLYRWYRDDFGGSDSAVIHHLMGYAEPQLAMTLQKFDHIGSDAFDWRLNDAMQ